MPLPVFHANRSTHGPCPACFPLSLPLPLPPPAVEGYTTPGGYSSTAVKPIALAKCMAIAQMMGHDFAGGGKSLSGLGGVNTGRDAAEFILLGSDTVQVRGLAC